MQSNYCSYESVKHLAGENNGLLSMLQISEIIGYMPWQVAI